MARVPISETLVEESGGVLTAVSGAQVRVNVRGTTTKAIVYAGETGTTQLANPQTVTRGRVLGWLDPAAYDLVITIQNRPPVTQPYEAASGSGGGGGGGTTLDASPTTKGKILLAGDLGGTADEPTVPGLASKVSSTTLTHVEHMTGAEYDALQPPDPNTLYFIRGD